MSYDTIPGFDNLLLEDSFVVTIRASPARFELRVQLVLLPHHPAYHRPLAGQQHCYVFGTITFSRVTALTWTGQGGRPAQDATGDLDWGGVDDLQATTDGWRLEGEWGVVTIATNDAPTVVLDNAEEP